MVSAKVIVTGDNIVKAKLLLAAPHILAHNRLLVQSMLNTIKPLVVAQTPLGPGHFGYHLRDTYVTDVKSVGIKTTGVLKAPAQGYWREFGTKGRSRKMGRAIGLSVGQLSKAFSAGALGGGGERAYMTAHKSLSKARALIKFYYGGMAEWWKL